MDDSNENRDFINESFVAVLCLILCIALVFIYFFRSADVSEGVISSSEQIMSKDFSYKDIRNVTADELNSIYMLFAPSFVKSDFETLKEFNGRVSSMPS